MGKRIKVFPYIFGIDKIVSNSNVFSDRFSFQNIRINLMPYGLNTLLLIVDQDYGNITAGRFLKLRRDVPNILNIVNGSEREISLLDDENIEDVSHFILNFNDNVLFAEYNHEAIRHFSTPLQEYLNFIFKIDSSNIDVIPNTDTFKSMETEKDFKTIKFKIAQSSLKRKENEIGISIIGALKEIALGGQTTIEVRIRRGKGIDTDLKRDKLIAYVDRMKDDQDVKTLEVESQNAAYDLLHNNLLCYTCFVNEKKRKIDRFSFYQEALQLYSDKIKYIKANLKI